MNNFITANDFKIDIALPLNVPQVIDSLNNDYIPKYQEEILTKLLGYTLYLSFESGLAVVSPTRKWLDLRDGCTYQDYDDAGKLQYVKFLGCKEIIKYYVYFKFLNDIQNKVGQAGALKQTLENAEVVPAIYKLYDSWNKMIDLYGYSLYPYKKIFSSNDYLTSYVNVDVEYNSKLNRSAYNFISRMNVLDVTTYENWNFTELTKQNFLTF